MSKKTSTVKELIESCDRLLSIIDGMNQGLIPENAFIPKNKSYSEDDVMMEVLKDRLTSFKLSEKQLRSIECFKQEKTMQEIANCSLKKNDEQE